ncbi:MAG: WecB/TagA/CpsF family glycosyltransferase [Blastomonas fulva]|uniref:WecB/TagA/CpsF family glycosyltransferase n=1 Tax=Blastomonas fulva TaxID=1550728 RepID=UPI0024E24DDB|nr:WecB/TagA/CpsF family glycosyltransferase [Blastomonas fulva]MDK2757451.1 WecB/TagA/CpsF family glycosyltransferase [Blastomonas fulva]
MTSNYSARDGFGGGTGQRQPLPPLARHQRRKLPESATCLTILLFGGPIIQHQKSDLMSMPDKKNFLFVEFRQLERLRLLSALLERGDSKGFRYIVTPNVDHVINLRFNPIWQPMVQSYAHATYVQNDSKIITVLARTMGLNLPAYPGSDLTRDIFENMDKAAKVLIIGGDAAAPDKLKALFNLHFIDQHTPPFGLLHNAAAREVCVEKALAKDYDFIFIAVGSPQGELIAHQIHQTSRSCAVALCTGASIDFLTGKARRAPEIFQKLAMEWAYRLMMEPRRLWRRYILGLPKIMLLYIIWVKHTLFRQNASRGA